MFHDDPPRLLPVVIMFAFTACLLMVTAVLAMYATR